MNVLGIHSFTHNSSAALVCEGRLVAFCEEERFSRIKGDGAFPGKAVTACLKEAGLSPSEVASVHLPFRPGHGAFRRLAYLGRRPARGLPQAMELARKGYQMKGVASDLKALGIEAPVHWEDHYLSHAMAVFFNSPFEEAAVLVVDGVGEGSCGALYHARRYPEPKLKLLKRLPFPHSLGMVYAAVTEHLGFRHNREEGKVMAMAALGDDRFKGRFENICQTDGASLRVAQAYFEFAGRWTTPRFHAKFGSPRHAEGEFLPEHFALARALQSMAENVCLHLARKLLEDTGSRNLCFTGGLALNPSLNGRLATESGCGGFFVFPAGGDAGAALGAAWIKHVDPNWHLEHAFWGPSWKSPALSDIQAQDGIVLKAKDSGVNALAAKWLSEGAIGAIFRGRSEMGPRALGHRSIVADPRSLASKSKLNDCIKRRDHFQPFAPVVLAENCERYFPGASENSYMLKTVKTSNEAQKTIPAVIHKDGTARVQSVTDGDATGWSGLLKAFARETDCPVLLNTSLNRRGEPLAESPEDALEIFRETDLDFLLLEDQLFRKEHAR